MKVRNGADIERQSEIARGLTRRQQGERTDGQPNPAGVAAREGRVQLGLAKAIQSEFDSQRLNDERREKIERLKQAIGSGSYQPPVDEVAASVGQEIVFEILSVSDSGEE